MALEAVLVVVATALFGVVVWIAAFLLRRAWLRSRDPEPLAWWRLVFPLFAGAVVLAFLIGWALQEPNPADEQTGIGLLVLATLTAGISLRALIRSAHAVRSSAVARVAVGTVGLVKPEVIVSEEFERIASRTVLAAAIAHETAHVRGLDPLRIWFAQLAADLQWPIPGTDRRFSAWLLALEAERDDEALAAGTAAEDLAEAILNAARLQCGLATALCASMAGAGDGIGWRVRRLLAADGPVGAARPRAFWVVRVSCGAILVGAVWLGLTYGDALLRMVPGIGP